MTHFGGLHGSRCRLVCPAGRGGGGARLGCRTAEMDRELGDVGALVEEWGGLGGVGADRCRCSQHHFPGFLQHMSAWLAYANPPPTLSPPPSRKPPSWRQPACVIYVGAPAPLCTHWKISSLHKNCLKNEICDYILFISGLC